MNQLSQKIITLSTDYLGPASERFINRQVVQHLKKDLDTLDLADLQDLSHWVNVSAGLLIDKARAQELASKITSLKT